MKDQLILSEKELEKIGFVRSLADYEDGMCFISGQESGCSYYVQYWPVRNRWELLIDGGMIVMDKIELEVKFVEQLFCLLTVLRITFNDLGKCA